MKRKTLRPVRLPASEKKGFSGLKLYHLSPPEKGPFSALKLEIGPDSHFPEIFHRRMWEFFLVLKGAGYGSVGRKRVRFKAGDHLFLPPGTLHDFHTGRSPMTALVIFSPRFDPRRPDVVRA